MFDTVKLLGIDEGISTRIFRYTRVINHSNIFYHNVSVPVSAIGLFWGEEVMGEGEDEPTNDKQQ